jgi:hypothetical protein
MHGASSTHSGSSGSGTPDVPFYSCGCESGQDEYMHTYCRRQLCWQVSQLHHDQLAALPKKHMAPPHACLPAPRHTLMRGWRSRTKDIYTSSRPKPRHKCFQLLPRAQDPLLCGCDISCISSAGLTIPTLRHPAPSFPRPHPGWLQTLPPRTST